MALSVNAPDCTRDLSEALEQQAATSEVLRVISSSRGELEPVFEMMLANAIRLCEAKFGVLFRYDGGAFQAAAWLGVTPEYAEFLRQRGSFRPAGGAPSIAFYRLKSLSTLPTNRQDGTLALRPSTAARGRLIAVPMSKENELVGAFVIYRTEVLTCPRDFGPWIT